EPEAVPVMLALARRLPLAALGGLNEGLAALASAVRAFGADTLVLPGPPERIAWEVDGADIGGRAGGVLIVGPVSELAHEPGLDAAATVGQPVSGVASMTRLVELSRRPTRPVTQDPVFIAAPRGDRSDGAVAAMLVRRVFYPRSTGLGELVENSDGPATAVAVRARLSGSLVQLDCDITADGRLRLAEESELDLAKVTVERGG